MQIKEEDKVTENTIMNESFSNGIYVIEVELKLDKVAKRIQYVAVAQTNVGVIIGKSVEFAAHNNGKARYCKFSERYQF